MDLSQEEFRNNLRLRYGLMPQDIPQPVTFVVRSAQLSAPYYAQRLALFLTRHEDAAKEWWDLGAWALIPSAINY